MFTTYLRAEITFDSVDERLFPAEQRVWSYVEQELLLPWFYLQVVQRSGRENYASMFMMHHLYEVKQFLDAQTDRVWVEQLLFVTPPYMNGKPTWQMEPLEMAGIVEDPKDGSHFVVCRVASGSTYTLRDDVDITSLPFRVLFSRERDLRI